MFWYQDVVLSGVARVGARPHRAGGRSRSQSERRGPSGAVLDARARERLFSAARSSATPASPSVRLACRSSRASTRSASKRGAFGVRCVIALAPRAWPLCSCSRAPRWPRHVADEAQPGGRRRCAKCSRNPAVVEHAEVADGRLEAAAVADGADDDVRLDRARRRPVRRRSRRATRRRAQPRLRPALIASMTLLIDDRRRHPRAGADARRCPPRESAARTRSGHPGPSVARDS